MSKKNRNKNNRDRALAGLLGTVHAPVAQVEDTRLETRQEFYAKEAAEESAKKAVKAASERAAMGKALFTTPSQELANKIPAFVRGNRTAADIQILASNAVEQASALLDSQGYSLSPSGWQKLAAVAMVNQVLDYSLASAWVDTFTLMNGLECFDSSECLSLNGEPEAQPVQPQPVQKFDDLDNQSAREVVLSACQGEARVWFDAFAASLQRNFNYILSDAEVAAIIKVMERGLQFNRAADWDKARLICVRNGSLPSHLKYPAELLNEKLEDANMDDFETKQAYRREFYKLQK